MGQIKVQKRHEKSHGMTKMDQTSKKSKEFQTRMGQKKIKDQTNLEQQLQTDQVEEPSPKITQRERDRATTEQPGQTSSNEMSWTWQKLTNMETKGIGKL